MSRTSPQDAEPPELPGYHYIRHIGAGGNARVYLYEQELPSRKVAVKVLNDSALSASARRHFITEANVTAVLAHRHIVQVFDAKVTDDGRPYIVMPFYPQPNLFVRARRAHFSVAQVLRIGIQIGSAVETSHRYGVLHRDIKPQNILTDSYGEPALTDFGIATTRPGDGPEGLSVPWSPPEILFGTGPGDRRSDVYSLGATLWHLLVGRPPFEQPDGGGATGDLMGRIGSDPPPRTQRADVPNSLERLLRQAMAKDPAARPQSAMELIRGLQSIEQELRLPLTHPILPVDEAAHGDTRGDTVARPAANTRESTFSPEYATAVIDSPPADEPAWSDDTRDLTTGRGRPAAPEQAADDPVRDARPARVPVLLDPSGGADPLTADEDAAGSQEKSRRSRVLVLAGGGALLVVVAVAAVLTLPHSGGGQPDSRTGVGQATLPGAGQGAPAPGQPMVTAGRVIAGDVEFQWTYANSAPGDTFHWQEVSGTAGERVGIATAPHLRLAVAQGHSVCITVTVRTADGEASQPSNRVCSPT